MAWYDDMRNSVHVEDYENELTMQVDIREASRRGWVVQSAAATDGHVNVRRTAARFAVAGPLLGGASRQRGRMLVTFVRLPGSADPLLAGKVLWKSGGRYLGGHPREAKADGVFGSSELRIREDGIELRKGVSTKELRWSIPSFAVASGTLVADGEGKSPKEVLRISFGWNAEEQTVTFEPTGFTSRNKVWLRNHLGALIETWAAERRGTIVEPSSSEPSPDDEVERGFVRLESLRAKGLISDDEFRSKREELLERL